MIQVLDWETYWSKNMVSIEDLKVHQDDRGFLFEMLHSYELPQDRELTPQLAQFGRGRFGQVYVVGNPARGAVRAFHKHRVLWDYFTLVSGTAKFCFVDDRNGRNGLDSQYGSRPSPGKTLTVVVSGDRPQLIRVPPGVFHGWKSLTDNAVLVSVGSEVYNSSRPDEIRLPPNFFNPEFGCDPWEVKGR